MNWVLVVITVFTTSTGVATETEFREFGSQTACEQARDGIQSGVEAMKGTLGREAFVACYPAG